MAFDFVNYDDPENVYLNPNVAKGLTLDGFVSAFTETQVGHWNPVTSLSHMLVSEFFGIKPYGHHLGNVLLHNATAMLLFLVLWRMTAFLWRSAFIAAVFAIHPLRVESVAWVTERKDVLSGVFFLLTLAAYLRYVRQPRAPARYVTVAVLFSLGLMSKSMLVTLPFILLLLDYWPLGRFGHLTRPSCSPWPLFREKIPLFAIAALCSVIQLLVNQEGLIPTEKLPLLIRVTNAIVSCVAYIGQIFHPVNLAAFYPHPENTLSLWQTTPASALLVAISACAIALRKTRPYLLVGSLWYFGMLIPVIGLVQSGELARADRYTYLPHIGLYLALTWAVADIFNNLRRRNLILGAVSCIVISALVLAAHRQTSHWRDSETLWRHALAVTSNNAVAHEYLGIALDLSKRNPEAIVHHQQAIAIKPDYAVARNNLAPDLLAIGQISEAIAHLQKALLSKPNYASAYNNLGNAFLQSGEFDEAIVHYRKAIEIRPGYSTAEANLGLALIQTGRLANAISHLERAIAIQPNYAKAQANLGITLLQTGRAHEAIEHLQIAVAYDPDNDATHSALGRAFLLSGSPRHAIAHFTRALEIVPGSFATQNELAWILATHPDADLRDGARAVDLAQQASRSPDGGANPAILRTLAASYAEAGRFSEAIETATKALQSAEAQADTALRESLRAQLTLYQAGTPFHQTP